MNKNCLYLLAPLALMACKDKSDDTSTAVATCEITAAAAYPVDGQVDAYYLASLEFELSDADASATIALVDSAGTSVDGTVSFNEDGDVVYFTPTSPLSPLTSYTATLSWCDPISSSSISFTTSELGGSLSTDLTGKTFIVDLSSGRFVEPPGVGELIGGLLENSILLGIVSEGDELEIRGAISETGSTDQDFCVPTLEDFPNADFSASPFFEIPEGDVELSVAGYDIKINAMGVSGTFAPDGSYFGGGTVTGELDVRDIGPLLKGQVDDTSPDYLCGLLQGFGVTCQTCSSDAEPYCASILVDQLIANEGADSVAQVDLDSCHEQCADSCTNKECTEAPKFEICQQ